MEYIKEVKENCYSEHLDQIEKYLRRVGGDPSAPVNISFFVDEAHNYFGGKCVHSRKKIAMFGIYIPEVLIHALDAQPVWILGGSRIIGDSVDDYLPRDVDPVVRSSVGYINMKTMENIQDCSLFIVPMVSDSIKKSLPLFPRNLNIHPFDVCSLLFESKTSQWVTEVKKTIVKLEEATEKELTVEKLQKSMALINRANLILMRLKEFYERGMISNKVYFFLRQSYYMTQSLSLWVKETQRAVDYYESVEAQENNLKSIALVGSSIFPPNDKIPELLDNLGIVIKHMDVGLPIAPLYRDYESIDSVDDLVGYIEDIHYRKTHGANHVTSSAPAIPTDKIDGIVFHLLKGQVNYAFMSEQYERFAAAEDISLITIETDYGTADLEQIKIRMEAFSEMLKQNK